MSRKPTLSDVANRAGVSLGTASNVLNAPEKVRSDTRVRVVRAMHELGYAPGFKMPALPAESEVSGQGTDLPLLVSAGYISVDTIVSVDVMPHRGDRITAERIQTELGGPAANVAVAAAAVGGDCSLNVELATAIGRDPDSAWALRLLSERGVRARAIQDPALGRLSRCVVLVEPNGTRTKINEPLVLGEADLVAHLDGAHFKRRHLHIEGYQLASALSAVSRFREEGWTASADNTGLSPEFLSEAGLERLLRSTDFLFLNRASAIAMLGFRPAPEALPAAFEGLLRRTRSRCGGATEVAVTLGASGAVIYQAGEPPVRVPALPVDVVDGTGAGDCFAGSFLAQRLNGVDAERAGRGSAVAASLSMTAPGAQGRRSSLGKIKATLAVEAT